MYPHTTVVQGIAQGIQLVHGRFAAGYYRYAPVMGSRYLCQFYIGHQRVGSSIPAFLYIAPHTAHIAAAQPYKVGGMPRPCSFALQGVEVFHYGIVRYL
jgi:hypothetical protein